MGLYLQTAYPKLANVLYSDCKRYRPLLLKVLLILLEYH